MYALFIYFSQLCCLWLLLWNGLRKWVSCVISMEGSVADGVLAPLPGRCAFYVAKKKRYCKMIVGSGKTFCGEHANAVCEWKYFIMSMLCCSEWIHTLLLTHIKISWLISYCLLKLWRNFDVGWREWEKTNTLSFGPQTVRCSLFYQVWDSCCSSV